MCKRFVHLLFQKFPCYGIELAIGKGHEINT